MGCPRCQSVHVKTKKLETGPHYAEQYCGDCGSHIKWVRNPNRESVLHRFFKPVGESGGHEYDYECCFGKKHAGELLSEIVESDPKYLEWMISDKADFPDEVVELIESVI